MGYRPVQMNERTLPRAMHALLRVLSGRATARPAEARPYAALLKLAQQRRLTVTAQPSESHLPRVLKIFNGHKRCRMRRVVRRSAPLHTVEFPSLKMDDMVQCEGFNEPGLALVLEIDPDVAWFVEHPLLLIFQCGGHIHGYTPDFEIGCLNGKVSVRDAKPADWNRSDEPDRNPLFPAIRAAFEALEIDFDVITATEIRKQPRWTNVTTLADYRFDEVPGATRLEVARRLAGCREITIGALLDDLGSVNWDTICALLARGDLHFVLERPLDRDAIVRWQGWL